MKHNEGKKRIGNKSINYINLFYKRPKFQESIIMLKERGKSKKLNIIKFVCFWSYDDAKIKIKKNWNWQGTDS